MRRWFLVLACACASTGATPNECTILCGAGGTCPSDMTCFSDGYCHEAADTVFCDDGLPGPADAPPTPDPPDLPDAAPLGITDEEVMLNPSLTGSVFSDFSEAHELRAADFTDGTSVLDNAPRRLILLDAPFEPGLAVIAGRSILEIRADGQIFTHDYRPASANGSGPDDFSDGVLVSGAGWPQTPGLVVGSASPGEGDGLYQIGPGWSPIQRRLTSDNLRSVDWDPVGRYASYGPLLYVSVPSGMYLVNPTSFGPHRVYEFNSTDVRQTSDGNFANVAGGTTMARIAPGFWDPGVTLESIVLGGGDANPAPTKVHAVKDETTLVEFASVDAYLPLAETQTSNWVWLDVVFVQSGPLGSPGGTFYLLESNRLLDRDRILRFVKSP